MTDRAVHTGVFFVRDGDVEAYEKLVTRWRAPKDLVHGTKTPVRTVLDDIGERNRKKVEKWVFSLVAAVSELRKNETFELCQEAFKQELFPLERIDPSKGRIGPSVAKVMLARDDCPAGFKAWIAQLMRGIAPDSKEAEKAYKAAEETASRMVHKAIVDGVMFDEEFWSKQLKLSSEAAPLSTESGKCIVGTSQELEKPYRRLTKEVDPKTVRPPKVLEAALKHVEDKQGVWSYSTLLDQYKSIRQDLTVQHVESRLALDVYKSNARASLSASDFGEFNVCLKQVLSRFELFEDPDEEEFICYDMLLSLLTQDTVHLTECIARATQNWADETSGVSSCLKLVSFFVSKQWSSLTRHAISARRADGALARSSILLEMVIKQSRFHQIVELCNTHYGAIPLKVLCYSLSFSGAEGKDECVTYCKSLGLTVSENDSLDAKTSKAVLVKAAAPAVSFEVPSSD